MTRAMQVKIEFVGRPGAFDLIEHDVTICSGPYGVTIELESGDQISVPWSSIRQMRVKPTR